MKTKKIGKFILGFLVVIVAVIFTLAIMFSGDGESETEQMLVERWKEKFDDYNLSPEKQEMMREDSFRKYKERLHSGSGENEEINEN